MQYKNNLRRITAFALDFLLLIVLNIIISTLLYFAFHDYVPLAAIAKGLSFIYKIVNFIIISSAATFLSIIIFCAYMVISHGAWSQSLGKRLMKLKVLNVAGEPIGYKQSLFRFSPHLLIFLFYLLAQTPLYLILLNYTAEEIAALTFFIHMKPPYNMMLVLSAVKMASGLICSIYALFLVGSAIFMRINKYNQAPHDLIAKTVVIKA